MRRLFAASLVGFFIGLGLISYGQSQSRQPDIAGLVRSATPGYLPSKFYPVIATPLATATIVGTLDTVVYLVPYSPQNFPLPAASMNLRTVTGQLGCAVKQAVWLTSPTTKRPTGTPIVGSNTGQACTGNNTNQTISIAYTFQPGINYWYGAAFTATAVAPSMLSIGGTAYTGVEYMTGETTLANAVVTGLTAPYTYTTDITTLDLTSATFTDVSGASGVPLLRLGT